MHCEGILAFYETILSELCPCEISDFKATGRKAPNPWELVKDGEHFEKPIKARCTLKITVQLSKVHSRDRQRAIQSQPWRMGGAAGARKAPWTSCWLACGPRVSV